MRRASELLRFARSHWHVAGLLPFMLIAFTVLHEAAHGLAVWLQGGRVTEFVWLPTGGQWGHVRYVFETDKAYSRSLIALAPYVLALAMTGTAILLSLRRKPWPHAVAGMIFAWLYVAPLAEIANAVVPWLRGRPNDLSAVISGPGRIHLVMTLVGIAVALLVGWVLQRRLYRARALSAAAYLITAFLVLGILACFV